VQTKLVDFGVAKVAGAQQLTQAGQIVGTPAYMAPEQWHGRAVDERTDFYALGGCLYHALIGRPAVSSAVEALEPGFAAARALEMPKVRPDVPEELARAVAKALSDEPRNRFSSAEEMAAAIGKAMPHTTAAMPTHRPSTVSSSMAATVTAPTPMPVPTPAPRPTPLPPQMASAPPPRAIPSWNAPPSAPRAPLGPTMPVRVSAPAPARSTMSPAVKSALIAGAIIVALGYMLRDNLLGLISRATAPKPKPKPD
jgi:serine/threonine-protein kinase